MKLLGFLVLPLVSAKIVVEYVTVTAFVTVQKEQLGLASAGLDDAWQSPDGASSTQVPVAAAEISTQNAELETSSAILELLESSTASATEIQLSQTMTASSSTQSSGVNTDPSTSSVASTASMAYLASSSSSETFSGDGTYYDPGMGACGETNSDSDYIVAISKDLFDQYTPDGNSNHNTLCGKKIKAYYEGNSVEVTVVDRCEGCSYGSLDFSPTAFSQLADEGLGRIKITWNWV